MPGPEKLFENRIKAYLTSKGIWHCKIFGCMFQRCGIPDLICCVNGRFVAVEVKSNIGRASPLQLYNINKIIESGGIAMVLKPKDFDDFKNIIEHLLIKK